MPSPIRQVHDTQVHDTHCFLFRGVPRTTYLPLLLPVSALPKDWLLKMCGIFSQVLCVLIRLLKVL